MNKTCGECRFYAKDTEHCKLKGIGWKFATDTPCSGFTPRKPITNGDKIQQMSNAELAEFLHDAADAIVNNNGSVEDILAWLNAPAESEVVDD